MKEVTASSVKDFEAIKKWSSISKKMQNRILQNVFCSNCHLTTMVDYTLSSHKFGILLIGKCKNCGEEIARSVEDE